MKAARFAKSSHGNSIIEYMLLVLLILLISMVGVKSISDKVSERLSNVVPALDGIDSGPPHSSGG